MKPRNSVLSAAIALTCLHCGPAGTDDGVVSPIEPNGVVDLTTGATAEAAAPVIQIAGGSASGTGCPSGSFSAVISQQQNGAHALTVLFRSFDAQGQAPVSGRARGELKSCQFAVNLTPQAGYQIALANIQTRGAVDVFGPRDTRIGLNNAVKTSREYFFNTAENTGFRFPILDTYLVNSSSAYTIEEGTNGVVNYGRCNTAAIARGRVNLNVTGANNYGGLGTIDQNGGSTFNLLTRACTGAEPVGDLIDIPAGDQRAMVKNACALRGVGTSSRTEVCYGPNGEVLSSRPDPNL